LRACGHFEESISIHRQTQDAEQLAATLSNLGLTRLAIEMPDIAYQHLTESLTLARQLDNPRLLSSILAKMGQVLYKQGDLSAQTYLQESLTIRRKLEDTRHIIDSLSLLALVTQQTDYLIEAMQLAIQLDNDPATLEVLVALAYHDAHQGKFARSAQILACVNTHPAKTDFTYPLYIQPLITRYALPLSACETDNMLSFLHDGLSDFSKSI
ncbi:MAG: tetratricopeptide repeat protein, partial [Anaerolineae bacterium]|nr:tetratricopeptide repeat protein [Anaerolineae bacterium]